MATYQKFNQAVEYMADGVYNFSTDTFKIALTTNASAPVATNSVLADLTQISYTNLSGHDTGYTATTHAQSSGTFTFDLADIVLTASGPVATFRWIVLYDDTPTSPADPLVAYFDYGSDLTMANGETLTITWNASGVFTLA